MLRVGLTGSIAVGKTFVCGVFRELGCHVLDADDVARKVVEPGTRGLEMVVAEFGDGILRPDGSLDRSKLGKIVFADDAKRKRLNAILHPIIIAWQDEWLGHVEADDPDGIAIVDAALMIESGAYTRFDKLIVVWCRPEIQLKRAIERDGLASEEAKRRIESQMPQEEKKAFADYLIDTSEDFDDTRRQVVEIERQLRLITNV